MILGVAFTHFAARLIRGSFGRVDETDRDLMCPIIEGNRNMTPPQPQSCLATSLAVLSLFFGVISVIVALLDSDPWLVAIYGLPLLGVIILPGAIATLLPGASTRTRIIALVGIVLGVLSVFLFFTLDPTWCTQHPSACA